THEPQPKLWRPVQLSRQQRCSQATRYRSCHVTIISDGGPLPARSNVFRNNAQILSSRLACDRCRIACSRYWGRSYSFRSSPEWLVVAQTQYQGTSCAAYRGKSYLHRSWLSGRLGSNFSERIHETGRRPMSECNK